MKRASVIRWCPTCKRETAHLLRWHRLSTGERIPYAVCGGRAHYLPAEKDKSIKA